MKIVKNPKVRVDEVVNMTVALIRGLRAGKKSRARKFTSTIVRLVKGYKVERGGVLAEAYCHFFMYRNFLGDSRYGVCTESPRIRRVLMKIARKLGDKISSKPLP